MVPEWTSTRSLPLPKVTSPVIMPLPPTGRARLLLPLRSLKPGDVPLSHMNAVSPAAPTSTQSASAGPLKTAVPEEMIAASVASRQGLESIRPSITKRKS